MRFTAARKRILSLGLLLIGCWLLATGFSMWRTDRNVLSSSELALAFDRLLEADLGGLPDGGVLEATGRTPEGPSWKRVTEQWGDPGYFVGATYYGRLRTLRCLPDLVASLEISADGKPIDTQVARSPPYGNSLDCLPAGYSFHAAPGTTIRLRATLRQGADRSSTVFIEPYWQGETKDRLVGIDLARNPFVRVVTWGLMAGGFALILTALWTASRS